MLKREGNDLKHSWLAQGSNSADAFDREGLEVEPGADKLAGY